MIGNKVSSTVLVISDNESSRVNLIKGLSMQFNVFSATNKNEGIEIMQQTVPDLILLDLIYSLPSDEFSIVQLLKNSDRLESVPVIILSDPTSENTAIEVLKMGTTDFIEIPFTMDLLLLKCNYLISNRYTLHPTVETEFDRKANLNKTHYLEADFKKRFEHQIENFIEGPGSSIPILAEKMLMSVSTLERWTKRIYNTTPKQYLLEMKLLKAELYLKQNKGSVNSIAYNLGFGSVSYFCVSFKKKYGKTPKSFMFSSRNRQLEPREKSMCI